MRFHRTSLPRLLGGSDHELPCNFHHDHLQLGLCRITWCVFLHICAPCLANGYIGFISLKSHQGQEPLIFEGPVWKQEEPGGKSEGNQRSKAPSKAVVEFQSRCLTYESFFQYIIQPPSDSCGSEMPVAFVSTAIQALCGPVFRLTQLLPGSVTCPSITGLLAALFEGTRVRFVAPVYWDGPRSKSHELVMACCRSCRSWKIEATYSMEWSPNSSNPPFAKLEGMAWHSMWCESRFSGWARWQFHFWQWW